jgi:hypothetical protein
MRQWTPAGVFERWKRYVPEKYWVTRITSNEDRARRASGWPPSQKPLETAKAGIWPVWRSVAQGGQKEIGRVFGEGRASNALFVRNIALWQT